MCCAQYMMSWHRNVSRITGPLWRNPQVSSGSRHRGPVMLTFDVSFDVSLNKLLNKQSRGRCIQMSWCSFDVTVMILSYFTQTEMSRWNNPEEWGDKIICTIISTKNWENHDDVIKWKHFPRYWPFVRGIHRCPVNSTHKGQWRGAVMFSLICVWINAWINKREAEDLRRHHAHYDVMVMNHPQIQMNHVHILWDLLYMNI